MMQPQTSGEEGRSEAGASVKYKSERASELGVGRARRRDDEQRSMRGLLGLRLLACCRFHSDAAASACQYILLVDYVMMRWAGSPVESLPDR